ncbi:hypothetical protein AB1K70_14550 [Bremerella sp. JC770]|uniref:hypothetical protein n=1 Tax=Bremerella sp. JC770 TaxID=3232137 RepID=UPI0034591FDF
MAQNESPYRSPHADSVDPLQGTRVQQINAGRWSVGFVFALSVVVHAMVVLAAWLGSQQPIINAVALNALVEPFRSPVLHWLSVSLMVLIPLATLLNVFAVFQLWHLWDNWRGATIMSLLCAIPVVSLLVMVYALARARFEAERSSVQI